MPRGSAAATDRLWQARPMIADSLANIERSLLALGRSACLQMLRPGLAPERVASALADLSLPSSEDVVALYGWRDGADASSASTLDELQLFPGFYMLSLSDAAANHRGFVADPRWLHGWLPVFANGGGDFYVVDLLAITGLDPSLPHRGA